MENKNIGNGSALTFLDIITHHKIEIPVIQRDYAQGRKSDRINPIRKKFIKDLIESLKDDSEQMHLDFIYGRIDGKNKKLIFAKNKEAIENIILAVKGYADQCDIEFDPKIKVPESINESITSNFIPLDGQQRLTTLFLLHWYILKSIKIEGKETLLNQLKGFTYKTRNSTKEFCGFIISIGSNLDFDLNKPISKTIEESPAFFNVWKKDPSVQGMLTTLDDINDSFKAENQTSLSTYWYNLTEARKVTFDFLDLDEYEQTDELYVKMNARGKQLTDFEHFKSWLHEYIKSNEYVISEENWSHKIDTNWLDLFWKNKPENTFNVDKSIYNCIKSINLYEYIAKTKKETSSTEDENEDAINKEFIAKINEKNDDKNFISVSEYEESSFFDNESLDFTFSSLNKLSTLDLAELDDILKNITAFPFLGSQKKNEKLPFVFLSENSYPSLPDRVFYYSFLLFVLDHSNDLTEKHTKDQLKKWIRICRNIIYNTYIQNPANFIDAIKAIKDFATYKDDIENEILKPNFSIGFFDSQLKEEIKKVAYFNLAENWREKILEIENHPYFFGQIDFIFQLNENSNDFVKFEFYCNKLSQIFDNPEANNFLFHRLLLSKGDYLIQSKSKWSFCQSKIGSLRVRQDNWRKVFNNKIKLGYLKDVLDERPSLSILENSLANFSKSDWTYFFIKEKYIENMAYLQNLLIDWNNEWDIRLLEKSTYTGKHVDLYSHSLYLDLKLENFDLNYIAVNGKRSETNKPKIKIKLNNDIIRIYYEPYFDEVECAFVIETKNSFDCIIPELSNKGNNLVYVMEKNKVAECYEGALKTITKLLKS